jgi:hypothetical protein
MEEEAVPLAFWDGQGWLGGEREAWVQAQVEAYPIEGVGLRSG